MAEGFIRFANAEDFDAERLAREQEVERETGVSRCVIERSPSSAGVTVYVRVEFAMEVEESIAFGDDRSVLPRLVSERLDDFAVSSRPGKKQG